MNPTEATVKLTYDKVKDGMVSIKLRVCYQTERPRYHLPVKEGVIVSPDTYKRLIAYHQTRSGRTAEDIRSLYAQILPFIERAEKIIESLTPFSFARFESLFYAQNAISEKPEANDVLGALMASHAQMDKEGRIGNADAYRSAAQSLKRFVDSLSNAERAELMPTPAKKNAATNLLRFDHITPAFLHQYEAWMLRYGSVARKEGNAPTPASLTTVGIYLRQLRTVFNNAIDDKVIEKSVYPFSRKGYVIPTGRNVKKALRKNVIRDIMAYECEPATLEERSRDLWVLSYLSNGMNLTDICNLRWSNISFADQTITFVRKKTSRTQRGNPITVVASLFDETKAIIERWGNRDRLAGSYVFPFLNDQMDPRRKKRTISQLVKTTNKYMKLIAKELGVEVEIKTYEARHSFASAMLKAGADLVYIKDKLGQSSLKSTESYVVSLHDEDEQTMLRNSLL
ncbi:site-specific integrase [Spirosoma sp. RP8]|uniref:Site-specific integrase n=1 Tax=Spirosoma liriopis TaxID=2937440 RepID=A0ABT0HPK5_9BACT|nr:site-specific integrase [Spirosoma liriopis]MCK8493568.1 site-specific integrase [Spirosoma liriopis]